MLIVQVNITMTCFVNILYAQEIIEISADG